MYTVNIIYNYLYINLYHLQPPGNPFGHLFGGVAILATPQSVIFAPTRPEHLEKRYGFVGDLHICSLKLV